MGRKKKSNPPKRVLVSIDQEIWETLEIVYRDKFSGRMKTNGVNNLVNSVLRRELKTILIALRETKNQENTK